MQVLVYVEASGRCPFRRWFVNLDPHATTKITIALTRLEQGNLSNKKAVGAGVFEYRVDFGPGYRVYFGRDGEALVILLGWRDQAKARTKHRGGTRTVGRL